jgi:hypothetical protein
MPRNAFKDYPDTLSTPYDCVRCGAKVPSVRELYAVCQRATRTWEGGNVEGFVGGVIAGIPFVLPSDFGPSVERREGEDIVVSVPLPVCDGCWKQLDGGTVVRILSACSQILFAAAVVTLVYLMFAKIQGNAISLFWPLGLFACAIPPHLVADRISSHWSERLKEYMRAVSQYDALLNTFPDTELLTHRPTALMEDQPDHDAQTKDA